jgi:hypothetical protein
MLRHGMIARRAAVAFPPSMPLIGAPAMLVFLSPAFVVEMSSRPAAVAARPVSAEPAR